MGLLCHTSFPGSSAVKESACNAGDPSFILGLGRSPGSSQVISYPLQYSCLENSMHSTCLVGYSTWACKESDMAE